MHNFTKQRQPPGRHMQVITEQSTSTTCSLPLSPKTFSPNPAVFLFDTLLLGFHRCISEPPASSVCRRWRPCHRLLLLFTRYSKVIPRSLPNSWSIRMWVFTQTGQKKKTSSRHPLRSKHVVSVAIFIMLLNVYSVFGNVKTIMLLLF